MINETTVPTSVTNQSTAVPLIVNDLTSNTGVVTTASISPVITTTVIQYPVFWDDIETPLDSFELTWQQTSDATPLFNIQT
jgi:hypothetical protein